MRPARLPALLLSITACACSQEGTPPNREALGAARVAVVNDEPVPESVLRIYALATERRNLDEMSPEERERMVNDVVGLVLLAQQAEKEGLTSSRTLAAQIELQRLQTVARAMASDYLEKNPPTDADLQTIYDENLPRLSGEQYKLRHILLTSKAEADIVIADLNRGSDFIELAQARADGPTGPNGGELGWMTLDSMPPSFAETVRAMTAGSYSTVPVESEAGYHVLFLEQTQRQQPPALEDIRTDLVSAAERKRLDDFIKMLRDAGTVTVAR
jgi:peptidyl-prolyl cis-trans isomerase C